MERRQQREGENASPNNVNNVMMAPRFLMRNAKVISISLPPDLSDEAIEIAKEERRSVSEVFREALRQYAAQRALEAVRKHGRRVAKKRKLTEEDVVRIVREGRRG